MSNYDNSTNKRNIKNNLEEGLSGILEESLNEIYIFDATTLKFIQVNKGARENLGYSMDELLDLTPVDIKPNHTESSFLKAIDPLTKNNKQKIEFKTMHRRKDGTDYLVEVHLQKMQLDKIPVFVAIILDITERTQNQLDLDQAHTFFDSTPDATVVVDEAGIIRVSNKQMIELLGYSPDELIGMNVDTLLPERYQKGHAVHRAEFSAQAKVRAMGSGLDLFAMTKDGREIPIEVSLSPIKTSEGNLVAAAIRDISARKAFEAELRNAKQDAEEATAAKTRFLATASHDLRQPLQALRLYLSALTSKANDPKMLQISEKMNLSLDTMGDLLDALLDISTLESGSVKVERKDVNLLDILHRITTDNAPIAEKKGLHFDCESIDCVVNTDPALLQRIINNFISNAIRYTESGTVRLRGKIVNDVVSVTVSDTGCGIPKDKLEGIFDEFVQLNSTVRTSSKGFGLGLSIVKHIARILEIPTTVSSVVGEGSHFTVELPLSHTTKVANHEPQNSPETTSSLDYVPTILIVDDEPAIVDAMQELLSLHDMNVITAEGAAEALAHIQEGLEPDFVLSDYRMPDMTGVELVQKIRNATDQELPITIMTGDTSLEEIEAANLDNCTIMQKPVNIDQLLNFIHSAKK